MQSIDSFVGVSQFQDVTEAVLPFRMLQQFEAALLYSQVMHKKMMYSVGSHLHFFAQHSPHSLTTSRQPSIENHGQILFE